MYVTDKTNAYKILVAKSKEKRPKCKWGHNVKVSFMRNGILEVVQVRVRVQWWAVFEYGDETCNGI